MTSTASDICAASIVEVHSLLESWLGAPGGGDFGGLEKAFAPDFSIIMPNGTRLNRTGALAFLRDGKGARGEGFRIAIEDMEPLHQAGDLVLMHYVERQWLGGGQTARRATALFRVEGGTALWLCVHESWISRLA